MSPRERSGFGRRPMLSDAGGPGAAGGGALCPSSEPGLVRVLSRESARAIDRLAGERYGMPTVVLMENAARALYEAVVELADREGAGACPVLVVCGPGNNGGDGLAAARHLHNRGWEVRVLLTEDAESYRGDAATNFRIANRMKLSIGTLAREGAAEALRGAVQDFPCTGVIIDAVFGTGLDREVRGKSAEAIRSICSLREEGWRVVAADVPSGLDADTGLPLAEGCGAGGVTGAVVADVTVTFAGMKRGFLTLDAQKYVGEVVVGDIGVPRELVEELGDVVRLTARPGEGWEFREELPDDPERSGQNPD